jgi:hypothetical protein
VAETVIPSSAAIALETSASVISVTCLDRDAVVIDAKIVITDRELVG